MAINPFSDPNFGLDEELRGQAEQVNPFSDPEFGRDATFGESLLDTAVAGTRGALIGTKALADAAGANRRASRMLGRAADTVGGFESAPRRAEREARQRKIEEAEQSGSMLREIGANLGAFAEAPIDTTVEALGTSLPTIAAAMATRGRGTRAAQGVGALQGAGITKGSIYDAVEQRYLEQGARPEEARARATEAQSYTGPNLDQIGIGTVLGGAGGGTGAESILNRMLGNRARQGIVGSTVRGALTEAPLEGLQGGQERFAQNLAERREGFDTPLWQGVAGQGALEAVAGGAAGAGFGFAEGVSARGQLAEPRPPVERILPDGTPAPVIPGTGDVSTGGSTQPVTPSGAAQTRPTTARAGSARTSDEPIEGTVIPAERPARPSQRMGLDPNTGPLTAAAATAVDTGLSGAMATEAAANQQGAELWDTLNEQQKAEIVGASDIRGVLAKNLPRSAAKWAMLSDDTRRSLAVAMQKQAPPAPDQPAISRVEADRAVIESGDDAAITGLLTRPDDHVPEATPLERYATEIAADALAAGVPQAAIDAAFDRYADSAPALVGYLSGLMTDAKQQNIAPGDTAPEPTTTDEQIPGWNDDGLATFTTTDDGGTDWYADQTEQATGPIEETADYVQNPERSPTITEDESEIQEEATEQADIPTTEPGEGSADPVESAADDVTEETATAPGPETGQSESPETGPTEPEPETKPAARKPGARGRPKKEPKPKEAKAEKAPKPRKSKAEQPEYGSKNTFVDKDAYKKNIAALSAKFREIRSGIDPEMVVLGMRIAAFHIEAGTRRFIDVAQAMADDLGVSIDRLRPYLRGWYNGARDTMEDNGLDVSGMDSPDDVRELLNTIGDDDAERSPRDTAEDSGGQDGEPGTSNDTGNGERAPSRPGVTETSEKDGGEQGGTGSAVGVRGPAAPGERGNKPVHTDKSRLENDTAGDPDDQRGPRDSTGGSFIDKVSAGGTGSSIGKAPTANPRLNVNPDEKQKNASAAQVKAQMPFLTDGQAEDVVFAERRFAKPDGYGVLFTNGTGTGKTFTGLAIVKRMVLAGKQNILVVAPKQPIISAWTGAGTRFFDLQINPLSSTKDAGKGISITTYANLGANNELFTRKWDAIVFDEAHYLSTNEAGEQTEALVRMRGLTDKPYAAGTRIYALNQEDVGRMRVLFAQSKLLHKSDDERDWVRAEEMFQEGMKIYKKLEALTEAEQKRLEAMKPEDRTRVVFLSATPFAYEKNVTWAQDYLFDWGETKAGGGYNAASAYEAFMMQHFGYRMRYGKLTAPDAKVDSGLMQRAFNAWLKREGVLSGRSLDSEFDYDRKFILTESAIGKRVDEIFDWFREEYRKAKDAKDDALAMEIEILESRMIGDGFDYLTRMYFLEAIKAREAVPIIKANLKLGRKVVVLHDFKKGGTLNPFRVPPADMYNRALAMFNAEFKDVINAFTRLPSPIETLTREFPDILVYNGSLPGKQRVEMQNRFNDDSPDGANLMLAQNEAMKEGVSIHDTTGKAPRVEIQIGMPTRPTASIQLEGRVYRTGQASNAMFRYVTIGSNWEKFAFASRIAGRASAAENLAMGEGARGLKQAFIDAYLEADKYPPGFQGEGTGGKARDYEYAQALTPWQMAKSFYFGSKKYGSGRSAAGREHSEFFATPEPVGLKMVHFADLKPGDDALEPSAGRGAIARWFPENTHNRAIEYTNNLAADLALRFEGDLMVGDFMDHHIINKYDGIVMNPPFGTGGADAAKHVEKAARHLRDGGRLVALIPTGPAADKKFEKLFDSDAFKPLYLVAEIRLPGVTFERAGTGVPTRIIVLEKQEDQKIANRLGSTAYYDFTGADTTEALFDRLENLTLPPRLAAAPTKEAAATAATSARGLTMLPMQSKHSKTGADLFVVNIVGDMGDNYDALNRLARANQGFYIKAMMRKYYKPADGIPVNGHPTFNFPTEADRAKFIEQAGGALSANEPGARYDIGEAGTNRISEDTPDYEPQPYETDLFGNPVRNPPRSRGRRRQNVQPAATVPGDTPAPKADYYVRTIVGSTQNRQLTAPRINSFADLAQATQYLYRSAVERLDAVVTDADGKPLGVVGGFKGSINEASVYPFTLIAEAVRIPGAARIWFAHNHPSGYEVVSTADRQLYDRLKEAFSGSGIEPMGLIAIGNGKWAATTDTNDVGDVPKPGKTVTVPVIEREQIQDPELDDRDHIENSWSAKYWADKYFARAKGPGVLFLNTRHQPVAWMPISDAMTGNLRDTGQLRAIYRAISESNPAAAIIVHNGELDGRTSNRTPIKQNIAGALELAGVNALDIVNVGNKRTDRDEGEIIAASVVFSRAVLETQGDPITADNLADTISARIPKLASAIPKLLEKGKAGKRGGVVVINSADPAQIAGVYAKKTGRKFDDSLQLFSDQGRIQGFYDAQSGLTFLVGPNLDEAKATGVLLHEIYHGAQRQRLDAQAAAMIEGRDKVRNTQLRALLDRVAARMADSGETGNQREAAAYLIEQAVNEGRAEGYGAADSRFIGWIENTFGKRLADLIAGFSKMVRQALLRAGLPLRVTVGDLVDFAVGSVNRSVNRGDNEGRAASFLRWAWDNWYRSALEDALPQLRESADKNGMIAPTIAKAKVLALQKAGKFKADELAWSGLLEWLDMQTEKLPVDSILDFASSNTLVVEDVIKEPVEREPVDAEAAAWEMFEDSFPYDYDVRESMQGDIDEQIEKAWDDPDHRIWNLLEKNKDDYLEQNDGNNARAYRDFNLDVETTDPEQFFEPDEWRELKNRIWEENRDELIDAAQNESDDDVTEVYGDGAKYRKYTLPGGSNYKELLITTPEIPGMSAAYAARNAEVEKANEALKNYLSEIEQSQLKEHTESERQYRAKVDAAVRAGVNRLAKEKAEADAKKSGGTVESHMGAALIFARSKAGILATRYEAAYPYRRPEIAPTPEQKAEITRLRAVLDEALGKRASQRAQSKYNTSHWDDTPNILAHVRLTDRENANGARVLFVEEIQSDWAQDARRGKPVPRAPFIEKTEAWVALAVKRVIAYAAENNYPQVAFINGAQSADRYNLGKSVDKLTVNLRNEIWSVQGWKDDVPTVLKHAFSDQELADLIGKDLAEKAIQTGGGEYTGPDLVVGGQGMTAFYDKIVPNVARSVLRKLGGDLTTIDAGTKTEQIGFVFNPALRAAAETRIPLFSRAQDQAETPALRRWLEQTRVVKPGDTVDGRTLREGVPNTGSIDASLDNYTVLSGVREIPLSAFDQEYVGSISTDKLDARTRRLAEQIRESGEIAPLIVVADAQGLYILEGGHRYDALIANGAVSLPAMVVIDESGGANPDIRFSRAGRDQTATPEFKRWFGKSKVVDQNGRPKVVYHGTQSTKTELSEGSKGDPAAVEALKKLASQHSIPDWSSVPAVFERWVARGTGKKIGIDASHAREARRLLDRSRGTAATTTEKLGFDIFAMPEDGLELGAHFGLREQAEMFGPTFAFYLKIENPLRLPDLGNWEARRVIDAARKRGVKISDAERQAVLGAADSNAELRVLLETKGYDGVVYVNEAEGFGDSYIAFRPEQIKSATDNTGAFNPNDPDIRFSRAASAAADTARRVGEALGSITVEDVKDVPRKLRGKVRGSGTDLLRVGLQWLGRRQITDIYGKLLPLRGYATLAEKMQADEYATAAKADQTAEKWGKVQDQKPLADLMHDATLAGIDADPEARLDLKQAADDRLQELNDRFRKLSPEAQAIYREARDMYREHHRAVLSAMKDRIRRSEISAPRKAELLKRMDDEFYKSVPGVYFPLQRFGKYVLVVKDGEGQIASVQRAETMPEANALRDELLDTFPADQGYTVSKVTLDKDFAPSRDSVGRGFIGSLYEALDEMDLGLNQQAELEDTIGQLYLHSMPDSSWSKHGIHRKGTPGFSDQARRAFAQNMFHGGRYLARLRYSERMRAELEQLQKYADQRKNDPDFDQPRAQRVIDEMAKRHDAMMNPDSAGWASLATSAGFFFFLGFSPASALVNLSQTVLVGLPLMGAKTKWGFDKSAAELMKASRQAFSNKNRIRDALTPEEKRAFDLAVRDGTIDVTQAMDLNAIAQGEDSGLMWALRPLMRLSAKMFHEAEVFNRQVTFIAAYRLARQAGDGPRSAFLEARQTTYDVHFDYSVANRPRITQGNAARVVLLFKQYAQNMIYTMLRNTHQSFAGESPEVRREALRAIAGIMGLHFLAAGALGLPLVGPILWGLSALANAFGDDDEPWDAELAMRNGLADLFGGLFGEPVGRRISEVLSRGVSRLTPLDISGRVALNSLIFPDMQEGLEGARWAERFITQMLGPVPSMVAVNPAKALNHLSEGRWQQALESFLPVAASNALKAYRYYSEGVVDKTGVVVRDEVSDLGIGFQAVGFAPSEVRRSYEGKEAIFNADRRLSERRSELLRAISMASIEGDTEAAAEARAEIAEFNRKNPSRAIKPTHIMQSVKARRRRIDQAEQGVYLPKNRREALEAGRFADY